MVISPNEIDNRKVVGTLKGSPVVQIKTIGGFYLLILDGPKSKLLATGPHPKISEVVAKRLYPDIEFSTLEKSEDISGLFPDLIGKYELLTKKINEKYE